MGSGSGEAQWPGALSAFWSMVVFLVFVGFATGFDWRWVFPSAAFWWALVVGASMVRARLAARPGVEVSPTPAPRFELKAPDPAPGQCPVCSLADLDELGVHDEMAAEIDPALVRVVAYGPHRAHYACAAVAPYVAPPKPARHHCFGFYTPAPGERWTYCGCEQMREEPKPPVVNHTLARSLPDEVVATVLGALQGLSVGPAHRVRIEVRKRPLAKGGYMAPDVTVEQMGPLPEVLAQPAFETGRTPLPPDAPPAGWMCRYCFGTSLSLSGHAGASRAALNDHEDACPSRPGVLLQAATIVTELAEYGQGFLRVAAALPPGTYEISDSSVHPMVKVTACYPQGHSVTALLEQPLTRAVGAGRVVQSPWRPIDAATGLPVGARMLPPYVPNRLGTDV